MKRLIKYFIFTTLYTVSISSFAQHIDKEVLRISIGKYIELKKTNLDTIYIRKDLAILDKLPLSIGNTPLKLLTEDNLYSNFIVLTLESKGKNVKALIKEFSVYSDDSYIGYEGGYRLEFKIKKHGTRIILIKTEKINY